MKKLLVVILFTLFLFGCQKSEKAQFSLKIEGPEKIYVGDTKSYNVIFSPEDYKNQDVIWSTSDESIITIDQNGVAKAFKESQDCYIYATSSEDETIKAGKKIYIYKETYAYYPDLKGYTIKIQMGNSNYEQCDPYNPHYQGIDKDYKQTQIEKIEKLYNCNIEFECYPEEVPWGPSRWSYIIDSSKNSTVSADFYEVSTSKIKHFVKEDILIDLSDFYVLYNNSMSQAAIDAVTYDDKMYGLNFKEDIMNMILAYDNKMLEELQAVDQTLENPAQLFLDGNWNLQTFIEYVEKVQNAMAICYGENGIPNSKSQSYYALFGFPSHYFINLSSSNKEPIMDTINNKINLVTNDKLKTVEALKEIYDKGYGDKTMNRDTPIKSLFVTGYLDLISNYNLLSSEAYLSENYDYVPWPTLSEQSLDDYKVALGNENTLVMVKNKNYSGYGEDISSEIIYEIVSQMFKSFKEYRTDKEKYQMLVEQEARKYSHTKPSIDAYIKIKELIDNGSTYYDPMCIYTNKYQIIEDDGYYDIDAALLKYINNIESSWEMAIKKITNDIKVY